MKLLEKEAKALKKQVKDLEKEVEDLKTPAHPAYEIPKAEQSIAKYIEILKAKGEVGLTEHTPIGMLVTLLGAYNITLEA